MTDKMFHLVSIYDFKRAKEPNVMETSVYGKLRSVRKVFPVFFDIETARKYAKKHIDRATQLGSTDDGKYPVIGIIIVEYKFTKGSPQIKNITDKIYNDNGKRNYTDDMRRSHYDMITYMIGEPAQLRGAVTKRGRRHLQLVGRPELVVNKYIAPDVGFAMLNMSRLLKPSDIYELKQLYDGKPHIQKAGNISKFVNLQETSDNYNMLNCTNAYINEQKNNRKY
jgi:hypothetical protein